MTRHHFAAFFCAVALAFAGNALAYLVTPLPGATPQQAEVNQVFPNPIGVVVTDDNGRGVANASISWLVPGTVLRMVSPPMPPCFQELSTSVCQMRTDALGVARLPSFYMTTSGLQELAISASLLDGSAFSVGVAYIRLGAGIHPEPARIEVVDGNDQVAVVASALAKPFRIRLTGSDGSPLSRQRVGFVAMAGYGSEPKVAFHAPPDPLNWAATTDDEGYAETGRLNVGWGMGTGTVRAAYYDANAGIEVRTFFQFKVTNAQGGNTVSLQDMWWGGTKENGWGVAIAQHKDKLFSIVFAYDANGRPTWYSMSDGRWQGGVGNQFVGGFTVPKGAPFYAYDASRLGGLFDTGRYGGTTLSFFGEKQGTLDMTMAFKGFSKNIERFDFSKDASSPITGVGDLWWGGMGQNGWGVSIMEQPGGLFSVWFTYDENGEPTWFAMTDGAWTSSNTYEGRMHRTVSSGWFNTTYDASQFRAIDVGPYKLRFLGQNAAELEYNVEGRTGTLSLSRLPFGDVD